MIVLDASATVAWLLQTPAGLLIEQRIFSRQETLHTVHLLDVDVVHILLRLVARGVVYQKRAEQAIEDLAALRITRYAPSLLVPRIWRLRQYQIARNAAYLALAEEIKAPLVTCNRHIALAPGFTKVELF